MSEAMQKSRSFFWKAEEKGLDIRMDLGSFWHYVRETRRPKNSIVFLFLD
jgi:hypothetical protein